MSETTFDAALPRVYSKNWRGALRPDTKENPRFAGYQAPGGEPVPFIQKSFVFSGGQSKDTAEYPFGGLWSNLRLNEKPQMLTVKGYLRGAQYIAARNALIDALRVPTDDDNLGYLDLPLWGRFPVVVGDNYRVSEDREEQGQCEIDISFVRAGVTITERFAAEAYTLEGVTKKAETINAVCKKEFAEKAVDADSLASGFTKLQTTLISAIGSVQGSMTALNTMTNKIVGISRLIAQGVRAPFDLAVALQNAAGAIVSGLAEIKNAAEMYLENDVGESGEGESAYPAPEADNDKKLFIAFLSAATYTVDVPAATVAQEETKKAMENLYRTMAFSASAQIMVSMEGLTFQKASGYWALLEKLEASISRDNPEIYTALVEMRIAVSRELSSRDISAELVKELHTPMPLLCLAQYLGCDESTLRRLNRIADSFVVEGSIIYV